MSGRSRGARPTAAFWMSNPTLNASPAMIAAATPNAYLMP